MGYLGTYRISIKLALSREHKQLNCNASDVILSKLGGLIII